MVKLFVGNLSDAVDSHRLKNLFLQYGFNVQECDVLKNFAFVHVQNEDDATAAIEKLEKHKLEGREIHIERSTSRLRKEPGMSDKCFTCGATDHKTPSCPQEQERRKTNKRPGEPDEEVHSKRPVVLPPINLAGGTAPAAPTAAPQCWGYKVGGGSDADPELPCPTNPELRTLYDQYLESRTRYFFYRERLGKELSLQPGGAAASAAPNAGTAHLGRIDLTRPTASAVPVAAAAPLVTVSYSGPPAVHVTGQAPAQTVFISAAPSAPYNSPFRGVTVNAPYGTQTVASAAPVAYSLSHYNTVPQVAQQTLPNVQQIQLHTQMGQPQAGIATQIRPQVTQVIPQQQTTLGYSGTQMVNVVGQPGQVHIQATATSQPYQLQAAPAQNAGYSALPQQPQRVQLSAPYQQSAPYQAALGSTVQQQNGLSWREMKAEPQY
ncbi:RNA-binding protein lark [Aphelenchoides avenae]|nr:RNA-binding protein lark [Aphelenchus avenae]